MKIYLSVDMEGIAGVVNWDYTSSTGYQYERARRLMTSEVNSAVKGAVRAGANEIIVNDSHNSMNNILYEELDPPAALLSGTPKMMSMMEGIDSSFAGVFLLGYHSRMNTTGVLNHSYSSSTVYGVELNGNEIGELGLNAYIAGYFEIPIIMVTGDNAVVNEAKNLIPGVRTVQVKETKGRYAALNRNYQEVRTLIEETAIDAINAIDTIKPVSINGPVTVEVTLMNSGMADAAQILPGSERTGPSTLLFEAKDILEAYRAFRTITSLASHL